MLLNVVTSEQTCGTIKKLYLDKGLKFTLLGSNTRQKNVQTQCVWSGPKLQYLKHRGTETEPGYLKTTQKDQTNILRSTRIVH